MANVGVRSYISTTMSRLTSSELLYSVDLLRIQAKFYYVLRAPLIWQIVGKDMC
jgi:hypothetical protein